MDEQSCLIDGFGPLPVVRPDSIAALGEVVRQAAAQRTAIYPVGGRTMLGLGAPPALKGQAVDLGSLAEVIDFPARDMTITVQAGITVDRLREILAKENLTLPIDVPAAARATLGGSLATNTSGARRYGFGTLRDYVIGISAVNDAGNEFKAGGRVVKNVAGYDLCKLLVGSLGTLGILTQVTLKLRPVPEEQALVTVACSSGALESVLQQVHGSRTRPAVFDLLDPLAGQEIFRQARLPDPEGAWVVLVGFQGNTEAVNWQVQQLVREVGTSAGTLEALVGFTAGPLWQALANWDLWTGADFAMKATLLPSAVASFCQAVGPAPEKPLLRAHAGNGIVTGQVPGALGKDRAVELLAAWRELAARQRGSVVVTRAPAAWKDTLFVWGPPPGAAWLMHEVKNKFDPRRLFNPGRFVDGI